MTKYVITKQKMPTIIPTCFCSVKLVQHYFNQYEKLILMIAEQHNMSITIRYEFT